MKIYFATDHAGFEIKNELLAYVRGELGYEVEDCGAYEFDGGDDYPDFIHKAGKSVSEDPENRRAIVMGASGQGEAMVANRYPGVRCALYYGAPQGSQIDASGKELDMIASTRVHNNANALSLGLRFINLEEAKKVVEAWLEAEFTGEERHTRRIKKIDVHTESDFDRWNVVKKETDALESTWYVKEGDVCFARLGYNVGFEQNGKGDRFLRPILVLKRYNKHVFTGVPLTTKEKTNHYYYDIGVVAEKRNYAILSQTKLMDTKRIEYKIGAVDADMVHAVKRAVGQLFT